MSRSNNVELINPAQKFFEWDGDNGNFRYYDREALNEDQTKGKRIVVPLPFKFLVLDQLVTIRGFSDADQAGFYSNEVRDVNKDTLVVKIRKGKTTSTVAVGPYAHIKGAINFLGADYAKSVYIAFYEGKKLTIGHITMRGAALSSWIEFTKKNKGVYDNAIAVPSATAAKKGKVDYFIPDFKLLPVSEEANQSALELDKQLQEHLTKYLQFKSQQAQTEILGVSVEDEVKKEPDPTPEYVGAGSNAVGRSAKQEIIDHNTQPDEMLNDLPF